MKSPETYLYTEALLKTFIIYRHILYNLSNFNSYFKYIFQDPSNYIFLSNSWTIIQMSIFIMYFKVMYFTLKFW